MIRHTPGSLKRLASELEDIASLAVDALEAIELLDLPGLDQELARIGPEKLVADQQELCSALTKAASFLRTMAEGASFTKRTGGVEGVTEHCRVKHARSLIKLVAFLFVWFLVACTSTIGDAGDEVSSGDAPPPCVAACTKFVCSAGPTAEQLDRCDASCGAWSDQTADVGPSCSAAWAELLECVAAAECATYLEWLADHWHGGEAPDPCESEREASELACGGVFGP